MYRSLEMWFTLTNTPGTYVIMMDVVIVQEKPPHWTLATCIPTKYHCCTLNQCNQVFGNFGGVSLSLDALFSPFKIFILPSERYKRLPLWAPRLNPHHFYPRYYALLPPFNSLYQLWLWPTLTLTHTAFSTHGDLLPESSKWVLFDYCPSPQPFLGF